MLQSLFTSLIKQFTNYFHQSDLQILWVILTSEAFLSADLRYSSNESTIMVRTTKHFKILDFYILNGTCITFQILSFHTRPLTYS